MALALYRPVFWIVITLQIGLFFYIGWRLRLRWWPAWLLRVAMVAGVLLLVFYTRGQIAQAPLPPREVLVVDLSASLDPEAAQNIRQQADAWSIAQPNRLVVAYATQARSVIDAAAAWPDPGRLATNLPQALNLAGSLLGSSPGRVILASDGGTDILAAANQAVQTLAVAGHRLDTVQLPAYPPAQDVYTGDILAPVGLWENTDFTVILPVYLPSAGKVSVRLDVDGVTSNPCETGTCLLDLQQGWNYLSFPQHTQGQGIITLGAIVEAAGDPRPENNHSFATVRVFPAPKVLFITSTPASAASFTAALSQTGLLVTELSPDLLTTNLAEIQPYQVIFLHNLLADQLPPEKMQALKLAVSRLGKGLIILGGRNSYTLGGYVDTMFEPFLPVKLEPPPRSKKPQVTILLILDRSASMAQVQADVTPISLAREAALRVLENLNKDDYLGVLTYADDVNFDLPINPVGDGLVLRQAQDKINGMMAGGFTLMYKALETGVKSMSALPNQKNRLIMLLSDGQATDSKPEDYKRLAASAKAEGITISTLGLGKEIDKVLMQDIAAAGNGRFHLVPSPNDLPRVMLAESRAAQAENIQEGDNRLKSMEGGHPVLYGFSESELPKITSYNALTSRTADGAEDILLSSTFGDPLLSAWQVGVGRVMTWTSDIGEEWTKDWPSWQRGGEFWAQVVRYALPNPNLGPAQVEVSHSGEQVQVRAILKDESAGNPLNLAKVVFSYSDAAGAVHAYPVTQIGPGEYKLEFARPAEGAYRAVLQYTTLSGTAELAAPFAVNYSRELRPQDPKTGLDNLKNWAQMSGGSLVALDAGTVPARVIAQNPGAEAAPWLLPLGLLLYWPLEILVRRRWLPWR